MLASLYTPFRRKSYGNSKAWFRPTARTHGAGIAENLRRAFASSCDKLRRWHFVPCAPFQNSSRFFLEDSAPLFEIKRNVCFMALVLNVQNPIFLHRTSARTGFSTNDCPINVFELQSWQWS